MSFSQANRTEINPSTINTLDQHYWIKIYANQPFTIYFLGPFEEYETAHQRLCEHIEHVKAQGKQCITSFQIVSDKPAILSQQLTHKQWLHALMEDYLHLNIP